MIYFAIAVKVRVDSASPGVSLQLGVDFCDGTSISRTTKTSTNREFIFNNNYRILIKTYILKQYCQFFQTANFNKYGRHYNDLHVGGLRKSMREPWIRHGTNVQWISTL